MRIHDGNLRQTLFEYRHGASVVEFSFSPDRVTVTFTPDETIPDRILTRTYKRKTEDGRNVNPNKTTCQKLLKAAKAVWKADGCLN